MFLVPGSQDLDTAPWCVSPERRDYFSLPDGEAHPNGAQEVVVLLCQRGALLGHGPLVHQYFRVFFC